MRAARFAHDDRLRPGAILKRALVDRLAERAGAVGGVAAAALRHVLVRHVAPVLLLVVDLPDGLLQAGPAVLDHQVRRSGAHLAGLFGVEERAHVAVRVADHRELLVVHAVVRPRVVEALILLEHGPRVPHQRHVGRFPDGEAAAAEANRALEDRLRRVRVVDAARPDGDAHLGVAKVGVRVRADVRGEEGELLKLVGEGLVRVDDVLKLLLGLVVTVLLVVALVGRHDVVDAVDSQRRDRIRVAHRLEARLVLEHAFAVLDGVDAFGGAVLAPILERQRVQPRGGVGLHVDGDDRRVLLAVGVDLGSVRRPGEVLRLELRRRRVGSARGCEVEQARKVRRVDVVELLRL
mmetsp:Transcript_17703/g.56986  ORF Transcript_17703/g.56986 Transcript_17703/m.56986 type:complete len:350 (+) Transcript_17703:827-1876(+)